MKEVNPGPLDGEAVEKIYQLILNESIRVQESYGYGTAGRLETKRAQPREKRRKAGRGMKVASKHARRVSGRTRCVQRRSGGEACWREVRLVPLPTFEAAFGAIAERRGGLHSGADRKQPGGPVHRSFDLLVESPLTIVGEVIIRHRATI